MDDGKNSKEFIIEAKNDEFPLLREKHNSSDIQ